MHFFKMLSSVFCLMLNFKVAFITVKICCNRPPNHISFIIFIPVEILLAPAWDNHSHCHWIFYIFKSQGNLLVFLINCCGSADSVGFWTNQKKKHFHNKGTRLQWVGNFDSLEIANSNMFRTYVRHNHNFEDPEYLLVWIRKHTFENVLKENVVLII